VQGLGNGLAKNGMRVVAVREEKVSACIVVEFPKMPTAIMVDRLHFLSGKSRKEKGVKKGSSRRLTFVS
jgi:hypothetical protein